MNNSPLISVALATYNGAKYIQEQLDSILTQTYCNLEIIIIDDCSTDGTIQILEKYRDQYSNIHLYLNESNEGVNEAFNRAISLCKGDFIAISDQDDIWLPNKLDDALKAIGGNMMVYSNSTLINELGDSLNRRMFKKLDLYSGNDPRALSIFNNIAGHTILFKAELLDKILPIPRHSYYDWWIAFVAANSGGVKFMQDSYVLHRIHDNNVSIGIKCTSEEDGFRNMARWTDTMLLVEDLKYRSYFEKLKSILNIRNIYLKKLLFVVFQIRYSKIIFNNKGVLSTLNRARKINLPHIPS